MRAVAAAAANRGGHSIRSPSRGCAKQARLQLTCIDFFDEQIFVCRNSLQVETGGLGECPATGQYEHLKV